MSISGPGSPRRSAVPSGEPSRLPGWYRAAARQLVPGPDDGTAGGRRPRLSATAFAAFAIFTCFAGDFWRNLLSWYGFAVIACAVITGAVVLLIRRHPLLRLIHLPVPLLLFMAWCLASIMWSYYRAETLLASLLQIATFAVAIALAVSLSTAQFLYAFSFAMRTIVGLSLAFEIVVGLFFPRGVLPLYMLWPGVLDQLTGVPGSSIENVPGAFKWSQGLLFQNAAIQGIVGNRNLLAMIALLCVIAVGVQWAARQIPRRYAIVWITLGVGMLLLCRSMTVVAAFAAVLCALLLVRIARGLTNQQRWVMYGIVGCLITAGIFVVVRFSGTLFALINRSSDMSGRGDIWYAVAELAERHPIVGLGWISYWAPWVEPYRGLLVVDGIQYLQAHNAYIDLWMQTGIAGAVLFSCIVLAALIRTWWLAVDKPVLEGHPRAIPPSAMLPFLVMVTLVVQSITESRLLIEGNWLLLCYFAILSKLRVQDLPALPRRTIPALTGPISVVEQRELDDAEREPDSRRL